MTLPIVERLRQEEHRESRFVNRGPTARLRNPDGPEAADTIEELLEVLSEGVVDLERYADYIKDWAPTAQIEMHPYLPGLEDLIERSRALLAKLGGDS